MSPRISVCIPTYNSARFLDAAIESALRQRYEDFELIVCDNASTDETPALCARHSDSRLRYHRFETLVNQGGNWNRCVSLAQGDYVALLHADDEYLPDFVAARVEVLDRHPEVGLAFGAVEVIDEQGRVTGAQSFADHDIVAAAPEFYGELLMGCVISPASPVVRRSCYASVGPFDERRLWAIDWDMWLRLAASYGVAYSPRPLSRYRVHGASGSTTGFAGTRYAREDRAVLRMALDRLERDPGLEPLRALRERALHASARRALYAAGINCEAGRRQAALANVLLALKDRPQLVFKPTVWALLVSTVVGGWAYRIFRRYRGQP